MCKPHNFQVVELPSYFDHQRSTLKCGGHLSVNKTQEVLGVCVVGVS